LKDNLIFGDSNVLMFRELHLQAGYEDWIPSPENPPLRRLDFEPGTTVRMSWRLQAEPDRTVNAYSFIAGSLALLLRENSGGDQIKSILAERGSSPYRVAFFFGQGDLDFVLWHVLGRTPIDPQEFVRQRAEKYIAFLLDAIGPRAVVTVMGLHPITVEDESMIEFFRKYGLERPRLPQENIDDFKQACPEAAFESRIALRREFERELSAGCRRHGLEYLEVTSELCDGESVKPEYRYEPTEVHVNLQNVLPIWLEKLNWLNPERVRSGPKIAEELALT